MRNESNSDRPEPWLVRAISVMIDLCLGKLGSPDEPRALRAERSRWLFLLTFIPPALWVTALQKMFANNLQGPVGGLLVAPAFAWVFGCLVWLVRTYRNDQETSPAR